MPSSVASRPGFDHEKLDVYVVSLDFISFAHEVIAAFPRGRSSLADQLERASMSMTLNTAEGSGEFSPKERVRFYRMALRSSAECAAVLDVARRLDAISEGNAQVGKELVNRIAAMLLALIRRHEGR